MVSVVGLKLKKQKTLWNVLNKLASFVHKLNTLRDLSNNIDSYPGH